MRLRNKVDGNTLVAELDIGRMADQLSRYVLVLYDDIGGAAALGPLVASVGYEVVESTPEEWAALTLAGFQLPHKRRKQSSHLRQLTCLMRAMKPTSSERRTTTRAAGNRHDVGLKQSEGRRRLGRHSSASPNATGKQRNATTGAFQRPESFAPGEKQIPLK